MSSTKSTRTHFLTGEFISEGGVRRVLGRRRSTSLTAPARAAAGLPANPSIAAGQATPLPPDAPPPLRRWSVAELIARAVAAPHAPIGHC